MRQHFTFKQKIERKYFEMVSKEEDISRARRRAYNRHFQGWLEYETVDEDGKKRLLRIYSGAWYSHNMSSAAVTRLKAMYIVLWAAAVAFFIFAASRHTASNMSRFAIVTETITVVCLIACAYILVVYASTKKQMTVGEYKDSSMALKYMTRFTVYAFAFTAAGSLFHVVKGIVSGNQGISAELLCLFLFLMGGASIFAIYKCEARLKYCVTPSNPQIPEGAKKVRDREN